MLSSALSNHAPERRSPDISTLLGGGMAILLAFAVAMVLVYFSIYPDGDSFVVLSPVVLAVAIGFYEDHYPVSARWRFVTYLLAAVLVLYFLRGFPPLLLPTPVDWLFKRWMVDLGWLGYLLGVLMLLWFLNVFNLTGGADGVVASESMFVSGALAGYLYYLDPFSYHVAVSLTVAALGFLLWNWPKTKISMGGVGSRFLGLILGVLILIAARQAAVLLYCGLILFGIFMVAAIYELLYRFVGQQKWFRVRSCRRIEKECGHLKVLLVCWGINLFWLLPISRLVFLHPRYALLGLVLAYLPLLYLAYRGKADQIGLFV